MIPAKEKKFNSFAFSEERNQLSRPDYLLQKAKKEQPLGSCRGPLVHPFLQKRMHEGVAIETPTPTGPSNYSKISASQTTMPKKQDVVAEQI